MTDKRYSILISYAIGAPIGLIAIVIAVALPVTLTREGMATIAMICSHLLSFLFFLLRLHHFQ